MGSYPSVWDDSWDSQGEAPWEGGAHSRNIVAGDLIGASIYELPPGATGGLYHFHHGNEEMIVVLKGTVTLRTPAGERDLPEGSVAHFPRGAIGAHQTINRTNKPTRHLIVGNNNSPDAVEYPDNGQVSVMARTTSQTGGPLWHLSAINSGSHSS